MAAKYKISYRKIFQVFFTLVISTCCVIAMISASNIESGKKLTSVEVHIASNKKYHFIEEKQILEEVISNRNIDIMNTPVEKIDVKAMERVLEQDPWVAHARLYIDNNRVLQMEVTQRIPLARLFQQNGASFYMDNTLHIMPLAPNFNFYTTVVTNVPVLGSDSLSWMVKKNIATMVRTLQADTFWNAQVSQVIIDSGFTFELMPVLGDQIIVFGDTSRSKEKLNNLYAFYNKVLNRIGWDKYEKLDLRFKNQVIASPSLPYKGPVDKADANINWLNAYVSTEVRKDSIAAAAEGRSRPVDADPKEEPKKDAKKDAKPADKAKCKEPEKPQAKEKGKPAVVAVKADVKKPEKKDAKKDDKKDAKHADKKEEKKDVKHTDKKEEKKDVKKDVKKADKKEAKKADKKVEKKVEKKPESKDKKETHAAEKKHDDKKENKAQSKPKEKAVLKLSDLGNEKIR